MANSKPLTLFFAISFCALSLGQGRPLMAKNETDPYLDLSKYPDLKLRVEVKKEKEKPVKLVLAKPAYRVNKPEPAAEVQTLFAKYGSQYNVNQQVLEKIARCESGFNPGAVNGPYAGMYQFLASTWVANRKAMGLDPDPSLRFSAEEAVKTTAYKISRDGTGAWPVCGR